MNIIRSKCECLTLSAIVCIFVYINFLWFDLFLFYFWCCVKVCRGFQSSRSPPPHIYNRTENKTTAVTYKVSISIHCKLKIYFLFLQNGLRLRLANYIFLKYIICNIYVYKTFSFSFMLSCCCALMRDS